MFSRVLPQLPFEKRELLFHRLLQLPIGLCPIVRAAQFELWTVGAGSLEIAPGSVDRLGDYRPRPCSPIFVEHVGRLPLGEGQLIALNRELPLQDHYPVPMALSKSFGHRDCFLIRHLGGQLSPALGVG